MRWLGQEKSPLKFLNYINTGMLYFLGLFAIAVMMSVVFNLVSSELRNWNDKLSD